MMTQLDWASISKKDDELMSFKIRSFYEYFNEDLRDEVYLRKESGLAFSNEELTLLVFNFVDVLAEWEKRGKYHGEVSTKYMFFSKEKDLKICERLDDQNSYPANVIRK